MKIAGRMVVVSALVLALTGCADPVRPGLVGRFGLEVVSSAPLAAVPLPAASALAPAVPVPSVPTGPGVAPSACAALTSCTAAPRPVGGSGGSAPVILEGRVVDAAGSPVVGAVVRGAGFEAVIGETGVFLAPTGGVPLTVEAPGFATQTAGPPYRFALESLAPQQAGTAFTLSGVTDPPLAQAVVTYADASGTVTSTRTGDDGSFSLTVEPVGPSGAAGAIAVYENLTLTSRERGVLQAVTPRLGAASLPAPAEAGPLRLVVADTAGTATVAGGLPAGLRAEEAVLSLTSDLGVNLPLVGSEGGWPASVPVFAAPGFKYTVALAALAADDSGRTVAERVGLASGERWAPTMLELPEATEAPKPGKRLKWKRKGPLGGMALFAPGHGKPAWESTADTDLPALAPGQAGFEVELQTWDSPQGIKRAAAGDRRYAVRRIAIEAPPEPEPIEEEPTASP